MNVAIHVLLVYRIKGIAHGTSARVKSLSYLGCIN